MAKKKKEFEIVTRVLPVELNDKEIQERGEKLAEIEQQLQGTREDAAADAARFRERKKSLNEQIAKLATQINDGKESRQVECELRPDYRRNLMEIVRTDLDEVVDSRALTAEERQLELGGKSKQAATETDGEPAEGDSSPFAAQGDGGKRGSEAPKPGRKPRASKGPNGVVEETPAE